LDRAKKDLAFEA
jgi:chromosome segregation ATPase